MAGLAECFKYDGIALSRATTEEIEELTGFINAAYWRQEKDTGLSRTSPDELRRDMANYELYVARKVASNEIAGTVRTKYNDAQRVMALGMLAVSEEMRGQGLAVAMVYACDAYARSCGAASICLAYEAGSERLGSYYEDLGFRRTHEVTELVEGSRLVFVHMSKLLGENLT